jgi:hypothetical protein
MAIGNGVVAIEETYINQSQIQAQNEHLPVGDFRRGCNLHQFLDPFFTRIPVLFGCHPITSAENITVSFST